MIALALCILAFVATVWAGRRSLGLGLVATIAVGYFYGILRANLLTTFSHFIFDASLLGLYLTQKWTSSDPAEARRLTVIRLWIALLMIWPALLVLLPFQPWLISLVGLRGAVFFIPTVLLGSQLKDKDLRYLASGLAVLNLVAMGFALAEYRVGVPRFFPFSPVTLIIYSSADVAGGYFRIPAIFTSAHAYGGTMISSLPFMIGLWGMAKGRMTRILAVSGIAAAFVGVLMSATRQNFIFGAAMAVFTLLSVRVTPTRRIVFILLIAAVGYLAMTNERFQRFKSLTDTEGVAERIAGSVNRGFWEILAEYPMGNGLGGGGTSIPYFLQGQVKNPIGMENEYTRVLSEQGVIGLILWLSFIFWFLSRVGVAFANGPWANTRRLAWCYAAINLGTAWVGLGLFTSIPGTVMLLLGIGWTATPIAREQAAEKSAVKLDQRYRLVPAG